MNIILFSRKLKEEEMYHFAITNTINKQHNVFNYGPGFNDYDPRYTMQNIIKRSGMKPDLIIFGTEQQLYDRYVAGLAETEIPKLIFLNKEFQSLDRKLSYIKANKFTWVSTILNKEIYKPWEDQINIPFIQTPHAIDIDKFQSRDIKRKYDFGFLGGLFEKYGVTERVKIKELIFNNSVFDKFEILWGDETTGKLPYGPAYIKALNECKTFLSTLSPIGIIGTRFYELMAMKTLILCPRGGYDKTLVDNFNCVMYDDDIDFTEKLTYYAGAAHERNRITNNARTYVSKYHTWDRRIERLIGGLDIEGKRQ